MLMHEVQKLVTQRAAHTQLEIVRTQEGRGLLQERRHYLRHLHMHLRHYICILEKLQELPWDTLLRVYNELLEQPLPWQAQFLPQPAHVIAVPQVGSVQLTNLLMTVLKMASQFWDATI